LKNKEKEESDSEWEDDDGININDLINDLKIEDDVGVDTLE